MQPAMQEIYISPLEPSCRQMPGIDKENLANTPQAINVTQASLFSWKKQENNLHEVLLHQYCAGMCKISGNQMMRTVVRIDSRTAE